MSDSTLSPLATVFAASALFLAASLSAEPISAEPISAEPISAEPGISTTSATIEADRPTASLYVPLVAPDDSLTLEEAIVATLSSDPQLLLDAAALRFQEGRVQEEASVFDMALLADFSFEYFKSELRASVRNSLQEQRDTLAESIADDREDLAFNQRVVDEIDAFAENPDGLMVSDPELQGEIDLLNFEIQSADDPAIRQRFVDLRDDAIADARAAYQQRVDNLVMSLEMDQGAFDDLGPTPTENETWVARLDLALTKTFRNGLTLSPFVEITGDSDQFVGKPIAPEFGGKGLNDLYRATVGLDLRLPLLRGAGRDTVTAFERAAALERDAAILRLRHRASIEVLQTVVSFWSALAAQETVGVLEASLATQERVGELTGTLIEADELPGVERSRVGANLADARSRLDAARRRALEARVALAETIGFAPSPSGTVPRPVGTLPLSDTFGDPETLEAAALASAAVARRADIAAADLVRESGEVLVRAARHDLRPLLDLGSRVYYNAISEDSLGDTFGETWVGPSYSVSFDYSQPFANNAQRGRLLQAEADLAARQIDAADIARRSRLGVIEEVQTMADTLAALRAGEEATRLFGDAFDAEVELFGYSESTLIDTLLTEQRATESSLSLIDSRFQLARLLALLRFETNSLVDAAGERIVVSTSGLRSLEESALDRAPLGEAPPPAVTPTVEPWEREMPLSQSRRERRGDRSMADLDDTGR